MITNFLILVTDLKLFDIELIDVSGIAELFIRFIFNLLVIIVLVKFLYYNIHKRKDYLFTYILFSIIIFLLCYLLNSVKLQLGFAFGLFAIFSILRYRTSQISIKEMTYLFVVIGISVINALAKKKISYIELVFTNFAILGATYILEKVWLLKHESIKTIVYENIELIKPEKRKELIEDIEKRTGLKINKVEVGKIDFMRDIAWLRVYYSNINNEINEADAESYFPADDGDD